MSIRFRSPLLKPVREASSEKLNYSMLKCREIIPNNTLMVKQTN